MKIDFYARAMLTLIAVFLGIIALRPLFAPQTARAQSEGRDHLYFEPGTHMLRAPGNIRQVLGKVAIDLRTGNVWGFPTLTQAPYPVDTTSDKPAISHPFLLGRLALEDVDK